MAEREDRRPGRSRQRYPTRRRKCDFCADRTIVIDYKDINLLQAYVSEHGRIRPRRRTGACARHQRLVAAAIKRARHLALVPYSHQHTQRYRG